MKNTHKSKNSLNLNGILILYEELPNELLLYVSLSDDQKKNRIKHLDM